MSILQIHHVQLAMAPGGEDAAVAFYEGIRGIPRIEKPPRLAKRGGCWFENDDIKLHLGVKEDFRPAEKAHPALLVDDPETLKSRLANVGVQIEKEQPLPGYNRVYIADPFGNRIELLEPDGV